jgi:hypothetical protein
MTEEQLQSIRKRLQAATPEPLVLSQYTHGGGRLWCESPRTLVADFYHEGDREFYGNALEDVQALLEENERLREVERKAQEQSEYIQAHSLTEIEVAALRAELARMRSGLEQIIAIGEESHGVDVTVSMFYAAHRALAR